MIKQAIILAGANTPPAAELTESLISGGISFLLQDPDEASLVCGPSVHDGLVLLYEVRPGASADALREVIALANTNWPGAPIIACCAGDKSPARECAAEAKTLKTLGFRAVADNPAQLPALLRQIEDQAATDDFQVPKESRNMVNGDTLTALPRALRGERLRKSFALLAALHLASDQKEAGRVALAGIAALVPADRWTIFLTTETGGAVSLTPLTCRRTDAAANLPFDGELQLELFDETHSTIAEASKATHEAAGRIEAIRKSESGRRLIALPLVNADRVLGVLEGIRERAGAQNFSRTEVSLLSSLAIPIAAALANSVRIADAERLSLTDDLTKLQNARYLRQFLVNEIKRARRYHSKVAALFLDLDDFKRINDLHGHLVGSHALMEMASVILPSVRDTDCVVRYGGDEFVVILPETGVDKAWRVADRIRAKIEQHRFSGGRRLDFSLSASFGIAVFPDHALSPQQLIACADTAMYEAKAAGKNCIRIISGDAASKNPDPSESLAVPSLFQRIPDEKLIS